MENDQKRKLKGPKFGKINSKLLGTLCWSINKLKSIVDENKKEGKNNFIFKLFILFSTKNSLNSQNSSFKLT
jgi:hypothetical protein